MGKKKKEATAASARDEKALAKAAAKAAKKAAKAAADQEPIVAAKAAKPRKAKAAKEAKEAQPATATTAPADGDRFTVAVPVVALGMRAGALVVATVDGTLPSVALSFGEDMSAAAARALATVQLTASRFRLFPLATVRDGADAVAAAWVALGRPVTDSSPATWVPIADAPQERRDLVDAAVERLGQLIETTTVATVLCPPSFTVGELREVYASVWGTDPDGRNFHRKVTTVPDFLVQTGEKTTRAGGRPAMLFRAGPAVALNPAIARP